MALSAGPPKGDELKSARKLGILSVVTTTVLIFCLVASAVTMRVGTQTQLQETSFLVLAEQQKSSIERLAKTAIVISESRRRSYDKGIAVSGGYGKKLHANFAEEFTKFQEGQHALQFGSQKLGTFVLSKGTVLKELQGTDSYYSELVTLCSYVRDNTQDSGDDSVMRKKLSQLVKMTVPYGQQIDRVSAAATKQAKEKNDLMGLLLLGFGITSLLCLLFILFVMTRGNLARLETAIRQLRETQNKLEYSLEESQTALSLSNMASRRFEQLFAGLPIGCFTCDHAGIIYEWNTACEQLTGYQAYEVYMKSVFDSIYANGSQAEVQALLNRVLEGEEINGVELEERRKDGSVYSAMVNLLPMRGASGEITSVIVANADITALKVRENELAESREELRAANSKLTALATTDGLTGLLNHRAFQEQLDQEFKIASQNDQPLSLILMDVDKFKQFNDNFGHPAGDVVLKEVAKRLRETAPEEFTVARYGGEEFVVVMPGTDPQLAVQFTELMRVAIESANWPHREVTASFGVATLNSSYSQPSDMIRDADLALYASKEAGRNRVTHFEKMNPRAA